MAIETHRKTKSCLSKTREHTASKCPDCGELKCLCRPRFFAGQLLTEEDLNLLDRYIIEKNKLHNRQLHGWGVVNGLEVTCHPCDEKVVTMHPGYAIGPCGNDIVVCEEDEVPICELINECKEKDRLGDPCKPHKKKSECDEREEQWVLALRYDERPSRGVGALRRDYVEQCEPRTVCETYRYEVYKAPEPVSVGEKEWWSTLNNSVLFQRMYACIKKIEPFFNKIKMQTNQYYLANSVTAGSFTVKVSSQEAIAADENYHAILGDEVKREYLTIKSVIGENITFTGALSQDHSENEQVITYDPKALSALCCQLKSILAELLRDSNVGNCEDIKELQCLECPAPELSPDTFFNSFLLVLGDLLNIAIRLLVNCVCFSLLPETTKATPDNRVPIAVISVNAEKCRVLGVCNWTIHRKFLVTMPNLFYWLHPLLLLVWSLLTRARREKGSPRDILERACCSAFEMFNFPASEEKESAPVTKAAYKAMSIGPLDSKVFARKFIGLKDAKGKKIMELADLENVLPFMLFNRLGSPVYKAMEANILSGIRGEAVSSAVSSIIRKVTVGPREEAADVTEMRAKMTIMEEKLDSQEKTIRNLEKKIKNLSG